jgi:hypothetical protein
MAARGQKNRRTICANGSRVWAESVGGAVPPFTCPGALAEKLSRWASHHGAVFAVRVQILKVDECRGTILISG